MNPTDAGPDAPDRSTGRAASTWFHPDGSLARDGWDVLVDGSLPGWRHTGLRVADLRGRRLDLEPGNVERLLVPLHGSFEVEVTVEDRSRDADDEADSRVIALAGRASVFAGPTDTLYLPPGTAATVGGSGRLAVAEAPATRPARIRHLAAGEAPVELRGRGRSSREVHDLGTPAVLDAERLIVCEVITPAGNWSSYPPHKHDEEIPGVESRLEEIYYFEAAPTAGAKDEAGSAHPGTEAFGLFTASSSGATEIALDERVRTGDVALIPGGYHGPAAAAPGYDLYYLNVMAGPGERVWRITDDPAHAWVRGTWDHEPVDPRLPLRRDPEGTPQ